MSGTWGVVYGVLAVLACAFYPICVKVQFDRLEMTDAQLLLIARYNCVLSNRSRCTHLRKGAGRSLGQDGRATTIEPGIITVVCCIEPSRAVCFKIVAKNPGEWARMCLECCVIMWFFGALVCLEQSNSKSIPPSLFMASASSYNQSLPVFLWLLHPIAHLFPDGLRPGNMSGGRSPHLLAWQVRCGGRISACLTANFAVGRRA